MSNFPIKLSLIFVSSLLGRLLVAPISPPIRIFLDCIPSPGALGGVILPCVRFQYYWKRPYDSIVRSVAAANGPSARRYRHLTYIITPAYTVEQVIRFKAMSYDLFHNELLPVCSR